MINVLVLVLLIGGLIVGWRGYRRILSEIAEFRQQMDTLHTHTVESVGIQRRREQAVEHLKTTEGRELLRARLRQRLEEQK